MDNSTISLSIIIPIILELIRVSRNHGRSPGRWGMLAFGSAFACEAFVIVFWARVAQHLGYSEAATRAWVDALVSYTFPVGPALCLLWLKCSSPVVRPLETAGASPTHPLAKTSVGGKGYYLRQTGQESGPHTLKELAQMKQKNAIATDAEYRFENNPSWQPITKLSTVLNL